jgi:Fic family protein
LDRDPIIDAVKVVKVSLALAYKSIVDLVQLGILEEITGGKRGKQYMFMADLNLFK